MKKIRWHGRGGNGAFTAAKLLGYAVSVYGNKYAQAFPSFGPERRGAPVLGFTRISDEKITDHSQISVCDFSIVLDETLFNEVNFAMGIEKGGYLIVNTPSNNEEVKTKYNVSDDVNIVTIDATKMAIDILGVNIVNTALMGAAMATGDICDIEDAKKAMDDMMNAKVAAKNKELVTAAYDYVKGAV